MVTLMRNYSVLIANNDDNAIPLFKEVLDEFGYTVTSVRTFSEVYRSFIKHKFDIVILTNLGLLSSDIISSAAKLKKIDSDVNILALSGTDDPSFIETLADVGLETFYSLPIDFNELHSRIQLILSKEFLITPEEKEYLIISPPDKPYTAKWCLEAHFSCYFPDEIKSNEEYSLLNFEGSGTDFKSNASLYKDTLDKIRPISGKIKISKNASQDVYLDLLIYQLKKTLQTNQCELYNQIIVWENSVRAMVVKAGTQFNPNIEIFVKVFNFIQLGYTTKYKKLADIFSLPISLYLQFAKLFKQKRE